MENKTINTSALYSVIADTLPMEGRDYTLSTVVDASGNASIVVTPLTDIGRSFTPVLVSRLSASGNIGATVTAGGAELQELATVASIRRNIEAEADEALKARIASAEDDEAKAREALENARKDNKDIPAANKSFRAAASNTMRLKYMSNRIPELRKEIDEEALAAARRDASAGKSWAVDMDAPLTSLFDRNDVTDKMRMKEQYIEGMAVKMAESNELKKTAVSGLKQYILPKEG